MKSVSVLLFVSWYPVEINVFKGFLDFLDFLDFTSFCTSFVANIYELNLTYK